MLRFKLAVSWVPGWNEWFCFTLAFQAISGTGLQVVRLVPLIGAGDVLRFNCDSFFCLVRFNLALAALALLVAIAAPVAPHRRFREAGDLY